MTLGSTELAHRVLAARNWRRVSELAGVAASVAFIATSAGSLGTVVQDFFSGKDAGWDLAMGPTISFGAGLAGQFPSFLANVSMVRKAKHEASELSDAVLWAGGLRNVKRVFGTVGLIMSPTFFPEGLKGTVFSGIPLGIAGTARVGEALFNAEAHHIAHKVLRRAAKQTGDV